jgi:hypothetical protein
MAVWLGSAGGIRLQRTAGGQRIYARIQPSDINTGNRRFGFDRPVTSLTTGDAIWIRRVDEQGQIASGLLDFVAPSGWGDGQRHSDGRWYANIDPVGGIRLYRDWGDAVSGDAAKAVELSVPSGTCRVSVEITNSNEEMLGQVLSFELNTNRDVADLSSLGDGFRQQMGTMVSGSGTVDCLWDYEARACDPLFGGSTDVEVANYLHQLVLRQEIGSRFRGIFLLKAGGTQPLQPLLSKVAEKRELFYDCECVITEVGVSIEATEAIHSKINFVTTGRIMLRYEMVAEYLLQEQGVGQMILNEDGLPLQLEAST